MNHNMPRRWLTQLIQDNGAVEIRHPCEGGWRSGWFDSVGEIMQTAGRLQGVNVYTTLNRPNSVVATNRMGRSPALSDGNVGAYTRLFFDFDPKRPSGAPATETELSLAQAKAKQFMSDLAGYGFTAPAFGCSGNGAHVLYRVRIPEVDVFHTYLRRLYPILGARYTDDRVKFDATVRNPGQLTRLYGSLNVKGSETPERPHRLASIWMPSDYQIVPPEAIWRLMLDVGADKEPPKPEVPRRTSGEVAIGRGDYSTLDVVGWFKSLGLYKRPLGSDGKHAVACPWRHEHSDGGAASESGQGSDSVIWEPNGGRAKFLCSHEHCYGRGIFEVEAHLGGADNFCSRELPRRSA